MNRVASTGGGTRAAPGSERVRIVLLSDPDLPTELAQRLAGELPGALTRRVADGVSWVVEVRPNPLAGHEQLDVTHMVDAVGDVMPDGGWDIGVCVTDLPRRTGTEPVAAEVSAPDGLALVSVPALGGLRLPGRLREAVVRLVAELHGRPPAGDQEPSAPRRWRRLVAQPGTRFVMPGARGRLRLLAGMVRANRPWRLFLGLSKALAGVVATAAIVLLNSTSWKLGATLPLWKLTLFGILAVAALVAWLVVEHDLWERPAGRQERDQATLYNAATVLTLTLGVLCAAVALYLTLLAVSVFVLERPVVEQLIQQPIDAADRARMAWFMATTAILGGALGSGLEHDSVVRRAAYGERQRQRRHQTAAASDSDGDETQ